MDRDELKALLSPVRVDWLDGAARSFPGEPDEGLRRIAVFDAGERGDVAGLCALLDTLDARGIALPGNALDGLRRALRKRSVGHPGNKDRDARIRFAFHELREHCATDAQAYKIIHECLPELHDADSIRKIVTSRS